MTHPNEIPHATVIDALTTLLGNLDDVRGVHIHLDVDETQDPPSKLVVDVTVTTRDGNGHHLIDYDANEVITETIRIPVTDQATT